VYLFVVKLFSKAREIFERERRDFKVFRVRKMAETNAEVSQFQGIYLGGKVGGVSILPLILQ
jgi:hypothetical protein